MATKILKLDFDTKSQKKLQQMVKRVVKVIQLTNLQIVDAPISPSNSGKYHMRIYLKQPIPDIVAVCLQALMGSDYKRETFNLLRVLNNIPNWNVLFIRKYRFKPSKKLFKPSKEIKV